MECIICDKIANATGSHVVPASLIQKCFGKHYSEESYQIDSSKATVDVYFGRDNSKNKNPEIKEHHFKADNILCQSCENKLGKLEGEFSTEFLQKFRDEKFMHNFNSYQIESGLEILESNKLTNLKIHAYFYSIILRFCRIENAKNEHPIILTEKELNKLKLFVYGFLYENKDYIESVSDFNLMLTFDKYSIEGSLVFAFEEYSDPYTFYFCEAIVNLFTNKDKINKDFNDCINTIEQSKSKIIVGPSVFYQELKSKAYRASIDDINTIFINELCELNRKSFEENYMELNMLVLRYEKEKIENPLFSALSILRKKYKS